MLRASIDLGTNTCLLLIAECDGQKIQKVILDESCTVRLGQGVDYHKNLSPDAIQRTRSALQDYAEILKNYQIHPSEVLASATSQARDSQNGAQFLNDLKNDFGFIFRVLSGDEEARAAFLGAIPDGKNPNHYAVIDIGGGSTEIVLESFGKSLDMGSVRFTERFLKSDPVLDEEFWECRQNVDQYLKKEFNNLELYLQKEWIAVAGTAVSLANIFLNRRDFNREILEKTTLTKGDLHRIVEELKWRTYLEREKDLGVDPKRADVLLAGGLILWRILEFFQVDKIQISTQGLRYGVLKNYKSAASFRANSG